jgi:O-antigen/teichoic acid export membrane protein
MPRFGLSAVKSWLGRDEFRAHAARLGGGTALGQGLVLLATPAITRLYSPEEIGLTGLFTAFLAVASIGASLRYEVAIGIAPDTQQRDALTLLSCCLTVPMALIGAAALYAIIVTDTLGFGALPAWSAAAMFALVVATGMVAALRFWFVASKDFSGIASALVSQGVGRALAPILLAPLGWGWIGLLVGEAAGRVLGIRRFLKDALAPLRAASRLGLGRTWAAAVRFRHIPFTFLPSAVLDAISASLPVPLIVYLYGVPYGGQFLLAQRVMLTPSALICGSLADVYQARFVDAARRDPASVRRLLGTSAFRLAAGTTLFYIPAAALAAGSFGWAFGVEWREAGLVAAALVPVAISGVVTNPMSRAMLLSRVPQLKLFADAGRLSLPAGALYVSHQLDLSFVQASLAFGVMGFVADCVYFAVIWYTVAPARQRAMV